MIWLSKPRDCGVNARPASIPMKAGQKLLWGQVGIIARIFGVVVLFWLVIHFGTSWYVALPLATLTYLAVPVALGFSWGLSHRLAMKRIEKPPPS